MKYRNVIISILMGLALLYPTLRAQDKQPISFEAPSPVKSVNSEQLEEAAPLITPNGERMYFTRTNNILRFNQRTVIHEIWYSDKSGNEWQEAVKAPSPLNIGHNSAVIGFNESDRIYLFGTYTEFMKDQNGASYSTKNGNGWSKPTRIEIPELDIKSGFYGLYVHPSEDVMLISKGSSGFEDLFVSLKQRDGSWSMPIGLGPEINSSGFEISPFLTADQKYLFFSRGSEGQNTDIFISKRLGDGWKEWSKPERLPEPINSPAFDAYFSITEDSLVTFSSNREGSNDIYFSRMYIEKPIITSAPTENMELEIEGLTEPIIIEAEVQPELRESIQENLIISDDVDGYVLFGFNQTTLSAEHKTYLNKIVDTLKTEPALQVEVSGHADYIDEENYNQQLSNMRALVVASYLLSNGIEKNRVLPVGYGETLPISNNEVAYGRMLNRRVEIRFIKNRD